jgi:polyisoprenoid-binding protein YceI
MSIVADRTATELIPTGEWSIDPVWSTLEFEVKKIGLVTIKGRVPGFEGTITGGDDPAIEGRVDARSMTTFDETRDGHLQSPDFFDTARYPELRFDSTSIHGSADDLVVEGKLTIKGTTQHIRLDGRYLGGGVDPYGNERIGIELVTTVNRHDFGLSWNAPLPGGGLMLPDDVVLRASFAAVRAS